MAILWPRNLANNNLAKIPLTGYFPGLRCCNLTKARYGLEGFWWLSQLFTSRQGRNLSHFIFYHHRIFLPDLLSMGPLQKMLQATLPDHFSPTLEQKWRMKKTNIPVVGVTKMMIIFSQRKTKAIPGIQMPVCFFDPNELMRMDGKIRLREKTIHTIRNYLAAWGRRQFRKSNT